MTFCFADYARIDADAVSALIANDEWERAYKRAQLLVSTLERAMAELGIEPVPSYIHDFTEAR
jgi:hypothetical protein